jgi:hypothetical protein
MEKRKTSRYALHLPVLFTWNDSQGRTQKEGGFTRDIGTKGVYVLSAVCPPVGTAVEMEVLLPVSRRQSPDSARLVATLHVLRTQETQEERGFAAAGELDRFRTTEDEHDEKIIEDPPQEKVM